LNDYSVIARKDASDMVGICFCYQFYGLWYRKRFISYILTNPNELVENGTIVYYFYQLLKQKTLSAKAVILAV
jgi:hypothetical protein